MAQAPRQYRPIDPTAARQRKKQAYDRTTDPDRYDTLADAYRDTYLGSGARALEVMMTPGNAPKGWDPLDHVPEGYDQYADAFAVARNPEQLEVVRQNIDARLANRERREKRGGWSTFKSDLLAGIFDPSILIAGPILKGTGLVGGAVKGAIGIGGVGAAQEGLNYALDPTMTGTEGALRAGSAVVFGGVLGGTVGGITGRSAASAARASNLTQQSILRHVLIDLEGGARVVNNRDGGGTTKFGFTQANHPDLNVADLTEGQAMAQAKRKYWLPEFDRAPPDLAAVAFDAYFISGNKKLARSILRAGTPGNAVALYRGFLNNLADTNPAKARFKKAWNNRVNKLASFIGAPRSSRYDVAVSTTPRVVDFGERGYLDVRKGPTGLRDENGNYIPAAYVRGKRPHEDEFTTVPVPERPERFDTVAETAGREDRDIVVAGPREGEPVRPVIRERVQLDDGIPDFPRKTDTPSAAATELDRLERGDAEAVAQTVGDKPRFLRDLPELKADLGKLQAAWRKLITPGDVTSRQELIEAGLSEELAKRVLTMDSIPTSWAEFQKAIRRQMGEMGSDNLPFTTKERARGVGLEIDDMLFMRGPVTQKGLARLDQDELNRLRDIIVQLGARDPEAAKIWMGSTWNIGQKLTKGMVKKRLDALVARRIGLQETAGSRYERLLDAGPDDPLAERREALEYLYRVRERIDEVRSHIDDLKDARDRDIAQWKEANPDAHPKDPGLRALKAEHERAISLQYERLKLLTNRKRGDVKREDGTIVQGYVSPGRLQQAEAELRRLGHATEVDSGDELLPGLAGDIADTAVGRTARRGKGDPDLAELNAAEARKRRLQMTDTSELRQKMAEKQDMIVQLHLVGKDRALGLRSEDPYVFTKKEQALLDRLQREIGDLFGRVSEAEALQAADRDLDALPFVLKTGKTDAPAGVDGDHIIIDEDALLASFEEKPWVQSVHGAPGLPEDAFKTPEEWVNFVYFHEREHVQNPRQEGESLADYETRINNRALEALRGENAPWKPVDGWKEELVLRPTPVGQFMQLVKNPVNYAWESLMRLASDYDLRLQRNLVPGGAGPAGGSVYQRSLQWQALGADYYNKISDLYLRYVRGKGVDGDMARQLVLFRHRKGAPGKMTFEEFDKAVGRVQITGQKSGIAELDEAAAVLDGLFKKIRQEEEKLGLLPGQASVERELKTVQSLVASLEKGPRDARIEAMLAGWKERATQLEEQLAENVELPGKKNLPYFERLWNVRAMLERPDEIKRIFAEGYQRSGQDPQSAWASATALFDDLTQDPNLTTIEVGAKPGSLRARSVPVENDEVVDFIHQNSTIILARHMRKNGAAVEMTRTFGDPTGEVEADRVMAALLRDGLSEDEMMAAMQIWFDMRDRIIGGFHGGNPLSTTNRMVRAIKNFTRTAVMGLSGISQLTDFVRSAWVVGPNSLGKTMIGYKFFQEAAGYDPGQYARAAGEALDIEMGILSRRMIEDDDWALLGSETAVEKWLADVQVPFFILNGVGPFTVMMKRWVARTVPTLVLDRADRIAAAVRSGRRVPEEDAIWLRELGIDEHDAQLLADLPRETTPGGLHLVDLDGWAATPQGERGRALMIGAISGTTRRSVATPGPLNRPAIFDGVILSKKKQRLAWERRWTAEEAHDEARARVIQLRRQGMGPGDDIFDEAVERLKEAAGTARHARNNVGVGGRNEAPLLSLPLQLQSFAISQASKLGHAFLSDRDKHKWAGLLALWAGGMVSSWLKGEITGSNENASIDEHLMRGFQNSGILSWFSIPLEGAKGLLKVAAEEGGLLEGIVGEDRPGLQDNTTVLGPGIGLGIGGLEALFGKGFDGSDLPASQRSYQLRRLLPFGNMIYFNWLTKMLFNAATPEDDPTIERQSQLEPDHYSRTVEQLMGFSVGDADPRIRAEALAGSSDAAEFETIGSDEILARVAAKAKRNRRQRRASVRQPLGLVFQ